MKWFSVWQDSQQKKITRGQWGIAFMVMQMIWNYLFRCLLQDIFRGWKLWNWICSEILSVIQKQTFPLEKVYSFDEVSLHLKLLSSYTPTPLIKKANQLASKLLKREWGSYKMHPSIVGKLGKARVIKISKSMLYHNSIKVIVNGLFLISRMEFSWLCSKRQAPFDTFPTTVRGYCCPWQRSAASYRSIS